MRQHLTISVEGTRTDQPERDAKHMLPITDLMPKGDSSQFTQPTTYKTRRKHRKPDNFQEYIKDLPAWERKLFLYWKHITDNEELKMQIMLCKIFYYGTDGGADDGIGYFGWLITTDTKIITKEYRQAHGSKHQMESL
eukprot:10467902-Ditylum_brightwellii.AAC.1